MKREAPVHVRGMNDLLPSESAHWQRIESVARHVFHRAGYREIRLPLVEEAALFIRSIGEVTDIVEKEMYLFDDRNGDRLALRPEATAGCVRAVIEHHLGREGVQRLWYTGPMFRHERPQKGRQRQFHQIGAEVFGIPTPDLEAELLLLTDELWAALGLTGLTLEINTLGTPGERERYRGILLDYFTPHRAGLEPDDARRLERNPLRLLDSKSERTRALLEEAPRLIDSLGADSRAHWERVLELVAAAGIAFRINPRLVRGLDYYTQTVFEWTSQALGAQSAVCSGGRYDNLVEHLGGSPLPAVGWALGVERLASLVPVCRSEGPDAVVIPVGVRAEAECLALLRDLHSLLPGRRIEFSLGSGSLKARLKQADRSGARRAVIVGEEERMRGVVQVKTLVGERRTDFVPRASLAEYLVGGEPPADPSA
jgi:histidyl-tRNA synthetase